MAASETKVASIDLVRGLRAVNGNIRRLKITIILAVVDDLQWSTACHHEWRVKSHRIALISIF